LVQHRRPAQRIFPRHRAGPSRLRRTFHCGKYNSPPWLKKS
jgi:hypothetical protein